MDWIFNVALLLAMAVTIVAVILNKKGSSDNDEYENYLDEYNDHAYYDRTSIRYRDNYWERKKK